MRLGHLLRVRFKKDMQDQALIKIIPQQAFNKIPWKNGKGVTLQLAINTNGCLANFEWRLSIATVDRNGEFSDFIGYTRNLVLIDGKGVVLSHNENQVDRLEKPLDFSTFDGANKTTAALISGPITDFNLMTKTKDFAGSVETFSGLHQVTLRNSQFCFIYGLYEKLEIVSKQAQLTKSLEAGDLMQLSNNEHPDLVVTGHDFILVYIDKL